MHTITTHRGQFHLRPVHPLADAALLTSWLTSLHAKFWDSLDATEESVAQEYQRIANSADEDAWIIERDSTPLALVETYNPARVLLREHVPHQDGDIGMHVLLAQPPAHPEHGLSDALFATVISWLVDVRGFTRILVEPDTSNDKILAKNARAGFRDYPGLEAADLGTKTARVQYCTPDAFACSELGALAVPTATSSTAPATAATDGHLQVAYLQRANREILAKMLREFHHERLLPATRLGPAQYLIELGGYEFTFLAHTHYLEHLSIDVDSLCARGYAELPGIGEVIAAAAPELGIPAHFLHDYLEEISATVTARARVLAMPRLSSSTLAETLATETDTPHQQANAFQLCESAMYEGHPGFVANAGRGGFSEVDARRYAPEMGRSTCLEWVAARRDKLTSAAVEDLDLEEFLNQQAPQDWKERLRARDIDPADYLPLPVHPWQWQMRVATNFADSFLNGDLIHLGTDIAVMHPQQSLRTFFNLSDPAAPYVKTAASVRNMGFLRGLSPKYMSTTPAINEWLQDTLGNDADFHNHNVRLLPEIAAVGFQGDIYHSSLHSGASSDDQHTKMLSALWRSSPLEKLEPGKAAMTLAAVLHVDPAGKPLVGELIARSGHSAADWLRALLDVYFRPAIRALAGFDIVFMPHSENVIVELTDCLPTGSWFKDLGEEVAVVNAQREVPEAFARIQADDGSFDPEQRALSLHTDIIDGVLRHLAALMDDHDILPEEEFWLATRACIEDYEAEYPSGLPLLAEDFQHSCLNRLQLRNPHGMVDLGDQNSSLMIAGRIANPLVQVSPQAGQTPVMAAQR